MKRIVRLTLFLFAGALAAACAAMTPQIATAGPAEAAPVEATSAPMAATEGAPALITPTATMTAYLPVLAGAPPTLPPPDEAAERLTTAPGFEVRIYADGLDGAPRFMAFGPDGHLYVSLLRGGQVIRLPDRDGDGLADSIEVAATNLFLPHGLEWHEGWLYVAEGDRVERLRDTDGDGTLDERQLVTDNIPGPSGHRTRTIHFGPDGKMYVSAGSSCNICEESDPRRAAILRFNPDGTIPEDNPLADDPDPRRQALWAWGLRNSVDFLFTPDGQLWADHNGSDGLGDDLPPEEIIIVVEGGRHHGWPYCYTPILGPNLPPNQQPEVRDERMPLPSGFSCEQVVPALFTDLAHSAPLGMTLGTGAAFPDEYRDDLFVAYHGSWNTSLPSARECRVQRIVIEQGMPVGSEPLVDGWRAPGKMCGDPATWGRPADVIFGPDGAMYISDDHGGRVYRVVYTGSRQ
ncbi:MAG: PQQ-dependent sugar dehydrogenase [Anaerolineae bacterium]